MDDKLHHFMESLRGALAPVPPVPLESREPARCARGASCVCTTEHQRSVCSYAPAPRQGGL